MNLIDSFSVVKNYFSPKIIGEVNVQYIKIAKINGENVPWHNHEKEDELFFIVDGELLMEIDYEPNIFNSIYDDQERKTSTNAFYFKIAASMYF